MRTEVAVLVPVKAFGLAKARLAPVLGAEARADLARELATRVLAAAHDLPVTVACDDDDVAAWAVAAGAAVTWTAGLDLNGAVAAGVDALAGAGCRRVVVAHGDLPDARDLRALAGGSGVVAVPDRRDDGTNVLVVPTGAGFRFAYGPGSFARHRAEAARLGLAFDVVRAADLVRDVDDPADLAPGDLEARTGSDPGRPVAADHDG
ncbi:MAG: 2-phospho-L-lactate guanylyltransferase [Acidimicrobiia bacterium]